MVGCTITPSRAAARLNSGVRPVQKKRPVNKRQAQLELVRPTLAQAFEARHKLRAGKNAGTPFPGSAFHKERSSGLDLAQFMRSWSKATAGTGLTIRSSRDRFAASCKHHLFSLAQGRKSVRLNSSVRCCTSHLQRWMQCNTLQSPPLETRQ